MKSEPVLASITAFVLAVLTALVAFDVEITADQTGAIVGFVAAAYTLALVVRAKVAPVKR